MDPSKELVQLIFKTFAYFDGKFLGSQIPKRINDCRHGISSRSLLSNRIQTHFSILLYEQHQICTRWNRLLQSWRVIIFSFSNYGPTLKQGNDVMKAGHNQVLWLYGDEVIEAGTSNVFFVFKGSRNDGKV